MKKTLFLGGGTWPGGGWLNSHDVEKGLQECLGNDNFEMFVFFCT